MAPEQTFVIVGASPAAAKAAQTLREGFTGRLVLIGEETEPPYERSPQDVAPTETSHSKTPPSLCALAEGNQSHAGRWRTERER